MTVRLDARLVAAALAGLAFLAAFAAGGEGGGVQLLLDLTIGGLVIGGIFALSAMGLVLTYRATGVFNLAHGAVAVTVAYVLWQLVQRWGVPLAVAAPVALLGVGPSIGVVLDRVVFRSLDRRAAGVADRLVATVGVFVLLVGVAFAVWGPSTRSDPVELFPSRRLPCPGGPCRIPGTDLVVTVGVDQLAVLLAVGIVGGGAWLLLHRTWLGLRIRAVVDSRSLAELSGVDADRVSTVSWAIGCGLAGLTGVLLAPVTFGLDPFRLTLLVTETFAVAVLARLVSLPLALGGGLFLGLLTSYGSVFSFADPARTLLRLPDEVARRAGELLDPLLVSVSVVVLFATLMLNRQLGEVGDDDSSGRAGRPAMRAGGRHRRRWVTGATAAALAVLPVVLAGAELRFAQEMLAMAAVFLSIVVVTGFMGHLTLGQAAFAGFGAFLTGRLHAGSVWPLPELPIVVAMVVAGLACVPLGLVAAWPALRRRGLFLALTTLALGLVMQRFVFENLTFVAGPSLDLDRPALPMLDLAGERAFYWFELAVLGGLVALARVLQTGRAGRLLRAIRDTDDGARAAGVDVRRAKLVVFAVSAFIAGIGGSLLGQTARAFSSEDFLAFNGLLWFAAVVVAGVATVAGAVTAAVLFTGIEAVADVPGLPVFLVGLAAISLGRLPGGIVGLAQRLAAGRWVPQAVVVAWSEAHQPPPEPAALEPTPLARRLLARSAGAERGPR